MEAGDRRLLAPHPGRLTGAALGGGSEAAAGPSPARATRHVKPWRAGSGATDAHFTL